MRKTFILTLIAVLFAGINSLSAQTPTAPHVPNNPLPDWVQKNAQKRAEIERATNRDPNRNILIVPKKKPNQAPADPPLSKEEFEEIRAEATETHQKFGVAENYRNKYEAFLGLEDTGIERLFEDKDCGKGKVTTLSELERCADVPQGRDGGSWVSFRCRPRVVDVRDYQIWMDADCRTKYLRDLTFRNNMFIAGDNGIIQGMIVDIGDVDLERVTKAHKAVEFIFDYDPKQTPEKIAAQREILMKGINAKGYLFSNRIPFKLNSTYVMRTVLYRYHEPGAKKPYFGTDNRMAFKVVGIEPDGSVVIIWREIDRQHPRREIEQK